MCTVIISVPETSGGGAVRLLAVRDEDPDRPWNRLGPWWDDAYEGVVGIRDVRAGGAWMAADPVARRVAVLLNRHDLSDRPDSAVHTRGSVALESVAGRSPAGAPMTRGFNLVEVTGRRARVVSWDGLILSATELATGVHMVAHDDVDDQRSPRIARWLADFRAASPDEWMTVLDRSAELDPADPAAIIRRDSYEGIRSYSLVVVSAVVDDDGVDVHDAPLADPGHWPPIAGS
ncbi:NRDE family protein [Microbacterium sp. ET2]|uniref:NRDE family protein n=1 Tax=Microbacterium albipurpureum TaxID=3050384 RepID=UPI00259C8823|nr:NRDE family protein [Microbacterium sp. ET2 (Ac-2212)]WJL94651.1 NRDE family protein [Microbacterium sp. ET2 (Ac-2212)]